MLNPDFNDFKKEIIAPLHVPHNSFIYDVPTAPQTLYVADTLMHVAVSDMWDNPPIELGVDDFECPWESVDDALANLSIQGAEGMVDRIALTDVKEEREEPGTLRTAITQPLRTAVNKYYKTVEQQRECLAVQRAYKAELVCLSKALGENSLDGQTEPNLRTSGEIIRPSFSHARIGKALVLEGFEQIHAMQAKVLQGVYSRKHQDYVKEWNYFLV